MIKNILNFFTKYPTINELEAYLKKGGNPNVQNKSDTLLQMVLGHGAERYPFTKMLFAAGADANLKNSEGLSSFDTLLRHPISWTAVIPKNVPNKQLCVSTCYTNKFFYVREYSMHDRALLYFWGKVYSQNNTILHGV